MSEIFSQVISEKYLTTIFIVAVTKIVELFAGIKMLKFLHESDIGVR